jgi:exonuclease SbcC
MRPLRLELEGFGPYRERQTVDFADADFFALVGPTGAGKSTVLDAITFALYGSVPRYDDVRLVAPALSAGANEARVTLTFEAGGVTYAAHRTLRRAASGGVSTREARLEQLADRGGDGGGGNVLAGTAREMAPAVQEVLGLPFDHFCKCVILPQGQFARFLHDPWKDRQEVLSRLIGFGVYERVGRRARQRFAQCRDRLTFVEEQLRDLADVTAGDVAALDARVEALRALHRMLEDAEPAIAAQEADAVRARAAGDEQEALLRQLRSVRAPAGIDDLAAAAIDARQRRDQARSAARAAQEAVEAAERRLTEVVAASGTRTDLEAARRTLGELAAGEAERDRRQLAGATLTAKLERARTELEQAEAALEMAEGAFDAARDAHAAHHLAGSLEVGRPCPVCRQAVVALPAVEPVPALDDARAAVEAARKRVTSARRANDRAADAAARAEAELGELERRLAQARASLGSHTDLARLDEALAALDAADAALETARAGDVAARRALAEADEHHDRVAGDLQRAAAEIAAATTALAVLDPPAVDAAQPAAAWATLLAWAAEQAPVVESGIEAARKELAEAIARRDEQLAALGDACRALGVEAVPGAGLTDLRLAVVAEERDAANRHARAAEAFAKAGALREEAEGLAARAVVADELGRLLAGRDSGFVAWLLDEALHALVAGASDTLRSLSGGAYSLVLDERDFAVIDHRNADERRPVRTLSGGETFQASLALALALSEQLRDLASAEAAPLEAIFLDEGFGTLDSETLDTVAGTIETLGASGRMVGVVTHVRELAERVPVRFEVRRDAHTARIERVDQ